MAEKQIIRHEIIEDGNPKKRRNFLVGILLLVVAAVAIVGFTIAFFSDVIFGGGEATAGTLNITDGGTKVAYHISTPGSTDGETITSVGINETTGTINPVGNLNPGDFIDFSYTLTNEGNKSAWLRNKFTVNVNFSPRVGTVIIDPNEDPGPLVINEANAGMFKIYQIPGDGIISGNPCTETVDTNKKRTIKEFRDAIRNLTDDQNTFYGLLPIPTPTEILGSEPYTVGIANTAVGVPEIINGTDETETGAVEVNPTVHVLLYFDKAATNVYQAAQMLFDFRTEAVQYRNNPSALGDGTDADWSDAQELKSEFVLGPAV